MNNFFFSFLLILIFITNGYAQDSVAINHNSTTIWEQNFSKAKKLTKLKDKPLLIFFTGSDWCGPCKKLVSDVFESDRFNTEVKNDFILYEADFPRNKDLITDSQRATNYNLKEKYGVSSYPTIVIVNEKGKELGRMKGYNLMRDVSYHYTFFDEMLKKIE
jgi:thioredoxin-related protein